MLYNPNQEEEELQLAIKLSAIAAGVKELVTPEENAEHIAQSGMWLTSEQLQIIGQFLLQQSGLAGNDRVKAMVLDPHRQANTAEDGDFQKILQDSKKILPGHFGLMFLNISPGLDATSALGATDVGKGNHWIYAVIYNNGQDVRLVLIDSMAEKGNAYIATINRIRKQFDDDLSKSQAINLEVQTDSNSCGIWASLAHQATINYITDHAFAGFDVNIAFSKDKFSNVTINNERINFANIYRRAVGLDDILDIPALAPAVANVSPILQDQPVANITELNRSLQTVAKLKKQDTIAAKELLDKGADINNQEDIWGNTPLIWAVANANSVTADWFAKNGKAYGINLNIQDTSSHGNTALHLAIAKGSNHNQGTFAALIKELLKQGANPNVQDKNGNTPLHIAVARRDVLVAKWLLENGANPDIVNHQGKKPADMVMPYAVLQPFLYNQAAVFTMPEQATFEANKTQLQELLRSPAKKTPLRNQVQVSQAAMPVTTFPATTAVAINNTDGDAILAAQLAQEFAKEEEQIEKDAELARQLGQGQGAYLPFTPAIPAARPMAGDARAPKPLAPQAGRPTTEKAKPATPVFAQVQPAAAIAANNTDNDAALAAQLDQEERQIAKQIASDRALSMQLEQKAAPIPAATRPVAGDARAQQKPPFAPQQQAVRPATQTAARPVAAEVAARPAKAPTPPVRSAAEIKKIDDQIKGDKALAIKNFGSEDRAARAALRRTTTPPTPTPARAPLVKAAAVQPKRDNYMEMLIREQAKEFGMTSGDFRKTFGIG